MFLGYKNESLNRRNGHLHDTTFHLFQKLDSPEFFAIAPKKQKMFKDIKELRRNSEHGTCSLI